VRKTAGADRGIRPCFYFITVQVGVRKERREEGERESAKDKSEHKQDEEIFIIPPHLPMHSISAFSHNA